MLPEASLAVTVTRWALPSPTLSAAVRAVSYTHLQRDGEAFKSLGRIGEHGALPDAGEQNDGQQEAETAGDTVHHGLDEIVTVLHVQQGHAQHLSLIHI